MTKSESMRGVMIPDPIYQKEEPAMPLVHWDDDVRVPPKLYRQDSSNETSSSTQSSIDDPALDQSAASHTTHLDATRDAAHYNSLITWMRQAFPEKWDAGTGVYVNKTLLIIRWQVPRGRAHT